MARAATGQVIRNADGGYSARVRVGPNARPQVWIFASTESEAETRAGILADVAKRLRPVAAPDEIAALLAEAGKARTEKALAVVLEVVEAIANGTTETMDPSTAFFEAYRAWCASTERVPVSARMFLYEVAEMHAILSRGAA